MRRATSAVAAAMLRNIRRYPEYRDSGVDWLGHVPAHWSVRRLKHIAPPRISRLQSKPEGAVYIGLEQIEPRTGRLLLDDLPDTVDSVVASFEAGDVLFGKLRPYLAKVARPDFAGVCSSEVLPLRPKADVAQGFLMYALLSASYIKWMDALTFGTKMPRVSPEQVADSEIVLPPATEQRAIAAFLDRETAKLDAMVAKQERLIELLQEWRTAFITHAVTRGLNPTAPTKESGIEWLGKIPAHWEVRPLKSHLQAPLAYGVLKPDNYLGDDGVRLMRILDIEGGQVDEDALERISPALSHEFRRTRVRAGDVVLSVVGTIGRACVIPASLEGANLSRALARIQLAGTLSAEFLARVFEAAPFASFSALIPTGTAQRVLNLGDLAECQIAVPPLTEQRAIAARLKTDVGSVERQCQLCHLAIDRLKELRTALISAAVTGRIDVREEHA